MALLIDSPTTEALSRSADEGVVRRYAVSIGGNLAADLVILRQRINVYLESSEEPVAVLRFGSPNSGALWLQGDLIGEFQKDPTGSFVVFEIEDGFKRPSPKEGVDPFEYLLERLRLPLLQEVGSSVNQVPASSIAAR